MKKIVVLIVASFLLFACKSKSVTNTKLDNKTERILKGNWKITSVTYPGSDYIKVTSFDIEDSKCFVESEWNFISNNNKGGVVLKKKGCLSYSTPITWYINKDSDMVIKFLDEGLKSRKVKEGYIIKVSNISENTFQLVDKINVGGKITDVVYQFQRIN
ncbi:MAG: lipocalin family protein [Flavobacterium sp.]|jgi:major membrane immunogen (membrane-anchored lipoprotein)